MYGIAGLGSLESLLKCYIPPNILPTQILKIITDFGTERAILSTEKIQALTKIIQSSEEKRTQSEHAHNCKGGEKKLGRN